MPEPTYRIAQRLHERRAAVGLPKYGRHLDADSQGCMLVHALEESADKTNYLLAEIQRRRELMKWLKIISDEGEKWSDWAHGWFVDLGGESSLAQYDEILGGGTVANSATVDPRDEALDTVEMALRNIVAGAQNSFFVKDNAQAALDALSRHKERATATDPCDEALRVATEALESCKWNVTNHADGHQMQFQLCAEKARQAIAAIRAAGGAR